MEQGKGVISPNDLMAKLAQAKKVMKKVDSGNFKTGQINEEILRSNPEDINIPDMSQFNQTEHLSEEITNYGDVSKFNVGVPANIQKIRESKLPDVIKQAMIDHPIVQPDISLTDGIDMKIIKGAKRLMEQDAPQNKNKTQQSPTTYNINEIITRLTPIIENTIRKVLDEKLNQLLTAQKTQSINENLVLKVGDSVFKGKITGVQSSKK